MLLDVGHFQAVKGGIQQAQNFISSTSESASAIAQNAKQYADEALGELKKVRHCVLSAKDVYLDQFSSIFKWSEI
jgi:hypothetical protein